MAFKTIHTAYGLAQIAAAESSGIPINLTAVAVGDGNGNQTIPSEGQSTLVREVFRAAPNRVYQDPSTPAKFTVEMIIPATIGGFTIREVGVFDADGGLFVVGNVPDTYKPNSSEGAFSDTVLRIEFFVSNVSIITLAVDPNVAVATQAWVLNNIDACQIIPGGTTGQFLRKASNTCGDTEWFDIADGVTVQVGAIEEYQTLAALQTIVMPAIITGLDCAVYVEGVRLRREAEFTTAIVSGALQITLSAFYPAGSIILIVENEPQSQLPYATDVSPGLIELATNSEVQGGSDTTRAVTPAGLSSRTATATRTGLVELATNAEVQAGTDTLRAVTPFGLASLINPANVPNAIVGRDENGDFAARRISADLLGNANTATKLLNARTINGVNFDGTAAIQVNPFISNNEATNGIFYVPFVQSPADGYRQLLADSGLQYNPSSNTLTCGLQGNAATASRLAVARNIALTGDVTGSATFDGSANVNLNAVVANDSHNHGEATIAGAFNAVGRQQLTSNGYQRLPGGLVLQWGTNRNGTVLYPVPFTSAVLHLNLAINNFNSTAAAAGQHTSVQSQSTSGFTVAVSAAALSSDAELKWMAIGF